MPQGDALFHRLNGYAQPTSPIGVFFDRAGQVLGLKFAEHVVHLHRYQGCGRLRQAAMDRVIAEFLEDGVDPVKLERIKTQMRASEIYALDSVSSLANRYGAGLTSGLTIEDIEAWPDILQSITGEDIVAAAKRVFQRKNAVTGYVRTSDDEVTQ